MTLGVLLPAALLAGFFGSAHCFGMCGAIVTLLERPTVRWPWRRRLAYNLGRLGFYVLLGAVAAGGGVVLSRVAGVDAGLAALRVLAGLLVIALALNLLFDLSSLAFLERAGMRVWRLVSPLATRFVPVTTVPRALGAGFVWGALPCGLVYSAVALAATSGGVANGALVMAAFWLGTLPALLTAGTVVDRLGASSKRPFLRRASGALLLVMGIVAVLMPFRHSVPHAPATDPAHQHDGLGSVHAPRQ